MPSAKVSRGHIHLTDASGSSNASSVSADASPDAASTNAGSVTTKRQYERHTIILQKANAVRPHHAHLISPSTAHGTARPAGNRRLHMRHLEPSWFGSSKTSANRHRSIRCSGELVCHSARMSRLWDRQIPTVPGRRLRHTSQGTIPAFRHTYRKAPMDLA